MADLYPWLHSNFKKLTNALKNSPHHAYIITGEEGLGKLNLVKQTVKYYLCDEFKTADTACGQCKSCLLISANNHPDIHIVNDRENDKVNSVIKIDQIRALSKSLASTAQIAATKIVIIYPAEKLNNNAANSFLKTLEEPQGDTLIFLISAKPFALPATILSRCIKMPILDINHAEALNWLKKETNQKGDVETAFKISNGTPLTAKDFLDNGLSEKRTTCFKLFEDICLKKSNLGSLSAWQEKEKIAVNVVINWIESWLSDLCKLSLGINDDSQLKNIDLKIQLLNIHQAQTIKNCFKQQKRTAKLAVMDKTSLNEKLLLTELLANIVMD